MYRSMPAGCLSLLVFIMLLILFPLIFANVMLIALAKLGLNLQVSLFIAFAIFIGGMINIPIRKIPREKMIEVVPTKLFGFEQMFPNLIRYKTYTIIAVNVGGCIVPCLIAIYELLRITKMGHTAVTVAIGSVIINTTVCYWIARPVPKVGITLSPIIPAVVAATCGLAFMRDLAPSIAFSSGVLGPLIGADLLHLRDVIKTTRTGVASIGGAGTFDGIVLSGLVATILA
jgi:uncharacterized membrane protein